MKLKSLRSRVNNQKGQLIRGKIAKSLTTFRKNKPNLSKHKFGAKLFSKRIYEIFHPLAGRKNKPNQTQFKPNSNSICQKPKMSGSICYTIGYNNKTAFRRKINKPKQSQFLYHWLNAKRIEVLGTDVMWTNTMADYRQSIEHLLSKKLYWESKMNLTRRELLAGAAAGLVAMPLTDTAGRILQKNEKKFQICIFSKHLQWLDYKGMAQTAAELGFDGVDLTVRRRGHVLPERVEDNLPKAVEAIKAAGIKPLMMASDINDPGDPKTEKVLKTASNLGIKYYRLGYYVYREDKSITATLKEIKPKIRDLAAMNKHFNIHGAYQNHAGSRYVGAPVWDLWELFKDLDPKYIGCQFDIRHATVEGGQTWPLHLRLMSKYIKTLVAKDFIWAKRNNKWQTINCPLGEGAVDFDGYLKLLKKLSISGPISVHYEYDLGGANHGATKLTMEKEKVLKAIRKDLEFLKTKLSENDLY